MKYLIAICIPFSLFAGAAMSQTLTPGSDQKGPIASTAGSGGATLSLQNARGKIRIKCAEFDNTRECVQAVLPVLSSGQGAGGVAYATTSIKCGDTIYQVSTGNSSGICSNLQDVGGGNKTTGVTCGDGSGNTSSATCDGGCGTTKGSGSCTIAR
jgi:hypothetical protein